MCSHARKEGARLLHLKFCVRKVLGGTESVHGKARHEQRICRKMERRQNIGEEFFMIFHKW